MTEYRAERTKTPGVWSYRGYKIWDAKDDYVFMRQEFIDGNTWSISGPNCPTTDDPSYLFSSKRACMNEIDSWIELERKEYNESKEDPAYLKLKKTIENAFKTYEAERKK